MPTCRPTQVDSDNLWTDIFKSSHFTVQCVVAPYRLLYKNENVQYQIAFASNKDEILREFNLLQNLLKQMVPGEEVLEFISKQAVNEDFPNHFLSDVGKTKLKQTHELHNAVKQGRLSFVIDALNRNSFVTVQSLDEDNTSPLHLAAGGGHTDIVKFLVDRGALINQTDKNGWTPLHTASLNHLEICKILVEAGADVSAKSQDGNLPLHYLARNSATNGDNSFLLVEVLMLMFRRGADINQKNINGETPLHEACHRGIYETIYQFIKYSKVKINLPNRNGETCLHYAIRSGNESVVELLLSMGADPNIEGFEGNCLKVAEKEKHTKLLVLLQNPKNLTHRPRPSPGPSLISPSISRREPPKEAVPARDQFGFLIDDDLVAKYIEHTKQQEPKDKRHLKEWNKYLESGLLNEDIIRVGPPLKRLVHGGIPHSLRAKLWSQIVETRMKKQEQSVSRASDYYYPTKRSSETQALGSIKAPDFTVEIEKDLERSFPEHPYFQTEKGLANLKAVLVAYSARNPLIGYCQSMNFIAGFLLLVVQDVEKSFAILCYIVEDLFVSYYFRSMIGVKKDQSIFERLLKKYEPKVDQALRQCHLPVSILTVKWFMCLFLNCLPTETVARIWDCFLLEGPQVPLLVALALFRISRNSICSAGDMQTVIEVIQNNSMRMFNADQLLNIAFSFEYFNLYELRENETVDYDHDTRKKKTQSILLLEDDVRKKINDDDSDW